MDTDLHDGDLLDVTCPRCEQVVSERFYGPCERCRGELRASLGGEQREVEAAAYEPKMNVTPNAVATKD
ncbi:MAG TPA: hypothetical protein VIY72_09075 [Acidimicrobiales bacterium]